MSSHEQPLALTVPSQVVVTRFECRKLTRVLWFAALHWRLKREIKRKAAGYRGSKLIVLWSSRTLVNVSLWSDRASIYSMGNVQGHVLASRLPRQWRVQTACAVYTCAGDWRRIMFGTPCHDRDPLAEIATE